MINDNQAAFIPERMIMDNVIIAHEVFHTLKAWKRKSASYMTIKTDITKAYDRLQWSFLEETMKHMGFDRKSIRWKWLVYHFFYDKRRKETKQIPDPRATSGESSQHKP